MMTSRENLGHTLHAQKLMFSYSLTPHSSLTFLPEGIYHMSTYQTKITAILFISLLMHTT